MVGAALTAAADPAGGAARVLWQVIASAGDSGPARPSSRLLREPDAARAELGDRAVIALAEEHFEPDLAIRERAHQAEIRTRRPGPFPAHDHPAMTGE